MISGFQAGDCVAELNPWPLFSIFHVQGVQILHYVVLLHGDLTIICYNPLTNSVSFPTPCPIFSCLGSVLRLDLRSHFKLMSGTPHYLGPRHTFFLHY